MRKQLKGFYIFIDHKTFLEKYDDTGRIIILKDLQKAKDYAYKNHCYYKRLSIRELLEIYLNVQQTLRYIQSTKFHNDNSVNVSDIFHRLQGK